MNQTLALKGQILFTPSPDAFEVHTNSWILAENGEIQGIFKDLPDRYQGCPAEDFGQSLIIPGFVDLHLHAPQFFQTGLGMRKTLLDWLNDYTYDLEARFNDPEFAALAYHRFANRLVAAGTLRAAIFGSSSTRGTAALFDALKRTGISAYVGKVNMDTNAPQPVIETAHDSLAGTRELIEAHQDHPRVRPIITPRFAPTCSRELLTGLGRIARDYGLPVQSHIGENREEIAWVKALFPEAAHYAGVYHAHHLFGQTPTLMAHAIFLTPEERALAAEEEVYLVHCPDSNINVRSGIMPVKAYLGQGMRLGLGSDIAGGHKIGLNEAMVRAVQLSKLLSLQDETAEPLTLSEAFYLGTKGGGTFFGRTGSFEKGYWLDALVIEDDPILSGLYSPEDRLEKFLYTGDDRNICARYVEGKKLTWRQE